MADIYKIDVNMSSKQIDELEKYATSQGKVTSGQMIVGFIKDSIKAYRNNILKRDADLDNIV